MKKKQITKKEKDILIRILYYGFDKYAARNHEDSLNSIVEFDLIVNGFVLDMWCAWLTNAFGGHEVVKESLPINEIAKHNIDIDIVVNHLNKEINSGHHNYVEHE